MGNEFTGDEKSLLKQYAPILNFHPAENFYPMNADAYIEACKLTPAKPGTGGKLKGEDLKNLSEGHYLHFVHDNRTSSIVHLITGLMLLFLLAVIWYSLQPNQFGLLKSLFCCWPPIWKNPNDTIRYIILSLAVLSWSFFRGSRRVHIAFVIASVTILFFGTPLGVSFGLIALIIATYVGLFYWLQQRVWRSWFV